MMASLAELLRTAKTHFDLTDPGHRESLHRLTSELLEQGQISTEDVETAALAPEAPLEFRLAAKLVDSRRWLLECSRPARVGVVFAMWGEHHRLLPRDAANPHGEDSLHVKLAQLEWATAGTAIDWKLYAVDDGCPHGSARLARRRAAEHSARDHVKVLELDEALPASGGPLTGLTSVQDSRKAGAIILGCIQALEDGVDAVIYTDADNSVHLGQIGLLLRPWVDRDSKVVLGDRKHRKAVLVKQEARWGEGIVLLRHMQRMIGRAIYARGIQDTQAAFKLYASEVLGRILEQPTVYDFSFDSDWILASLAQGVEPVQVPFAFIDSAAESASIAQGPMTTWEALLKGLASAVRRHGVEHDREMARVLDEEIQSADDLDRIIDHLPPALANAPSERLGDPELMSPSEIRDWIRSH
ncbi:MAG: glycosyltransferase [bacterium]|nr:glycosyltransferase [bacterium]MCP5067497.1 glycosyltransferase [bacterium]